MRGSVFVQYAHMNAKYIALACASVVLLGSGCVLNPATFVVNKLEEATKDVAENRINAELNGEGSIDLDNNSVTFTDENNGSVQFGENVSIPDNFPKEIPILDGAKVVGVAVTVDEGSWVSLTTDKTVDEVARWYDEQLLSAGWTVEGSYTARGMATKMYENGSMKLSVIISAGEDGGPTGVMVTESFVN
jgi:hypothetical protein